jgi:hypothetical protein
MVASTGETVPSFLQPGSKTDNKRQVKNPQIERFSKILVEIASIKAFFFFLYCIVAEG